MKKLIVILWMAIGGILGITVNEITDDKIDIPLIEKEDIVVKCPSIIQTIAYTDAGKFWCDGPPSPELECERTDEILSKIG